MKEKVVYAIDCGGTNLRVGAINNKLEIIYKIEEKVISNNTDLLYKQISKLLNEVYKKTNIKIEELGFQICGIVKDSNVYRCGNLHIENGYDFKNKLKNEFNLKKLKIANDGNASAYLEANYGVNSKYKDSVFITISTGIGFGLILNNEMIDLPLELGRKIIEVDNEENELEYFASGNGIVNLAKKYNLNVCNAIELFDLVDKKDENALEVFAKWKNIIVNMIYNIHILFNIESYAFSGGVLNNKLVSLDEIGKEVQKKISKWNLNKINLQRAKFKNDVGLLAAASLVL